MLDNLVTYHIHQQGPLPAQDALGYQYLLAGNGVYIRTENRFFQTQFPIAPCVVRGLAALETQFHLKVPRLPGVLLGHILADARQARHPGGALNEALYRFHHWGQQVRVEKPAQRGGVARVSAAGSSVAEIIGELHTHGQMDAFFSQIDDADEQGCQFYAVAGRLDARPAPQIRLRLGVYGYWLPLPVTAVFTDSGPFQDLYDKEKER
jgi:PRTRC genetic system protein A